MKHELPIVADLPSKRDIQKTRALMRIANALENLVVQGEIRIQKQEALSEIAKQLYSKLKDKI